MNKTLKFIGLLAILPLALVALKADAASPQRNDANINNADDQNESQPVRFNGSTNEQRDTSTENLAKGQK